MIKNLFGTKNKHKGKAVIKKGKRGNHWFVLRDYNGTHMCNAPVPGFNTTEDAERALHKLIDLTSVEVTYEGED